MPSIYELGLLADAAYTRPTAAIEGWNLVDFHTASGAFDGFQAASFSKDGEFVLAFRGTAQGMDAVADLKLGSGMNTSYFSAAEKFAFDYQQLNVTLCGHSLGGAITQIVGNRRSFPFVTFNAPGVAVFASRNITQANPVMLGVRVGGSLLSAVRHPMQAYRDVKATFNVVRGVNICLQGDIVSAVGVHYGRVMRIPGTSLNPLTEHRMTTMLSVLRNDNIGRLPASNFY